MDNGLVLIVFVCLFVCLLLWSKMKKLGQHIQPSQSTYHLSQKHVLFVVARFFFVVFFFR